MMSTVLLFLLPGAFHSPQSYQPLINAFNSYNYINGYKLRFECIDYQRNKFISKNEMATMKSYINQSIKIIKTEYLKYKNNNNNNNNDNCKLYLIGHSMGSRIMEMVINDLIKYNNFKISDICGMIHICGTVFEPGQYYKQLDDKHNLIVQQPKFKQDNNIIKFNCIEDKCWMRINTLQFAKYFFINDIDDNHNNLIKWFFNTLQPEITSNVMFKTYYDKSIVNSKNFKNLYIHTLKDKCIHISIQKEMCDIFGIKDRIEMDTGHDPFIAKPNELCQHICKWIQSQQILPNHSRL